MSSGFKMFKIVGENERNQWFIDEEIPVFVCENREYIERWLSDIEK